MRQHLSFREHFRRGNAEASDTHDENLASQPSCAVRASKSALNTLSRRAGLTGLSARAAVVAKPGG